MARRFRRLTPYLFLLPGGLWLLIFFVVPMLVMASVSLQEGSLGTGYRLTWNFGVYAEVIRRRFRCAGRHWPSACRARSCRPTPPWR